MFSYFVLFLAGAGALALVLVNRDDSIFAPLILIGIGALGFAAAWFFTTPTLFILFAIPTGIAVAWIGRDELVVGRRWFAILGLTSAVTSLISFFANNKTVLFTSIFVLIAAGISLSRSYDVRWTGLKREHKV